MHELDWVRTNVLPAYMLDEVFYRAHIETCRCRWGSCGHCAADRHERCAVRGMRPRPGPETYLVDRTGGALMPVWRTGRPCAWTCSCCGGRDLRAEPSAEDRGEWVLFDLAAA